MAIINKVTAKEYGDDAKKPVPLEKVKTLAHGSIKMLIKKGYKTKTAFFVKAGHYKNDSKKVTGHFLAIGDSSGLLKKFKKEKASSEVAYGTVYVDKVGNKETVYFEYVSGQGKLKKTAVWEKLLKGFKKALKRDCVFLVDGQAVQSDEEDTKKETKKSTPQSDTKKEKEPTVVSSKKEEIKELLQGKKKTALQMIQETNGLKSTYDRTKKEELHTQSKEWLEKYEALGDQQKQLVQKEAQKIEQINNHIEGKLILDNKITKMVASIHNSMNTYLELEDLESKASKALATKIVQNIDKVMPQLEKINDLDLLYEFEEMKDMILV